MQVLEEYMNAGVLLINRDGIVVMTSPRLDRNLIGKTIAEDELVTGITDGNSVSMVTKRGGWFDEPMMVVG
mgnify:CR=1 FL=1